MVKITVAESNGAREGLAPIATDYAFWDRPVRSAPDFAERQSVSTVNYGDDVVLVDSPGSAEFGWTMDYGAVAPGVFTRPYATVVARMALRDDSFWLSKSLEKLDRDGTKGFCLTCCAMIQPDGHAARCGVTGRMIRCTDAELRAMLLKFNVQLAKGPGKVVDSLVAGSKDVADANKAWIGDAAHRLFIRSWLVANGRSRQDENYTTNKHMREFLESPLGKEFAIKEGLFPGRSDAAYGSAFERLWVTNVKMRVAYSCFIGGPGVHPVRQACDDAAAALDLSEDWVLM